MPLPSLYKFHIKNNTGVTLDFTVDDTLNISGVPWKWDSNGVVEYGAPLSLFSTPGADLVDGAEAEGSEIDNRNDKYIGLYAFAELISDDSPNGSLEIYYEWPDGTGVAGKYPSDAPDFDAARIDTDLVQVGILIPEGVADDRISTNFEV